LTSSSYLKFKNVSKTSFSFKNSTSIDQDLPGNKVHKDVR
jgi:hypothetical protein